MAIVGLLVAVSSPYESKAIPPLPVLSDQRELFEILPIRTAPFSVAESEAFYQAIKENYEYVIDNTEQLKIKWTTESTESELLNTGNLSYLKLADKYSERLKELRDATSEYNNFLARARKYSRNLFLAWGYAYPPDYLKLIKLGE